MNPLVTIAIQELPDIFKAIRDLRAKTNPDLPPLTDAEVYDIVRLALDSTEAKDDLWLAAHPEM